MLNKDCILFICHYFAFQIAQCVSSPIKGATSFIDLPVEIQLMICKDLNLMELINFAKAHPNHGASVQLAFKDNFSKSKFEIKHNNYIQGHTNKIIGRIVTNEDIVTFNYGTILEALSLFGHSIQKLDVNFDRFCKHTRNLRIINQHINKYLADSLTEITLRDLTDNCGMVEFNGPFTKAVNVSLLKGSIRFGGANFAEVFPFVQRLSFEGMDYVHPNTMTHRLIHLEFIEFESSWPGQFAYQSSSLEQRLAQNSQLRHLSFYGVNAEYLSIVNRTVPNLECLQTLYYTFDRDDREIRFDNLKVLKISEFQPHSAQSIPLVFDNLEVFAIGWLDRNELEMIHQFLRTTETIKKFSFLKSNEDITNAFIRQITPEWNLTTTEYDRTKYAERMTFYRV